jgi:hypothetical protein
MADLVYPTNAQLGLVAQELVTRLTKDRPVFSFFPIVNKDTSDVMWEQRDIYTGLMAVRGLNGEPGRVTLTGGKRFIMPAGVYGEYVPVDEKQLTERRQYGDLMARPVNVTDLVRESQDILLKRRLDRQEQQIWTLLVTGTFSVLRDNVLMHTDSYTTQTFSSSVPWATIATATPLADFRAVQLLARGYSVSFGPSATAYMNLTTYNRMISNTNASDLGGRRLAGLAPVNGPMQLNQLMMMDGLPKIEIYDQGYVADGSGPGSLTQFIPDNKIVVIGNRLDGDPVGEYVQTRNASNPGMAPGPYTMVIDKLASDGPPRTIFVHDGFNGGTAIYHPSAIVVMTVS